MVMKTTEDGVWGDVPGPLDGTKGRRIFTQRPVRPDIVVIGGGAVKTDQMKQTNAIMVR
jgi:hypothetical protein